MFYGLLPQRLQSFFVRPFDFQETAAGASYKMERLNVPDMAVQWIHDAMTTEEFGQALRRTPSDSPYAKGRGRKALNSGEFSYARH